MTHSFTLSSESLVARPSGALFLPDHKVLCVSDLHLGKSERMARRAGVLLPPYEARETLMRLESEVEQTGATTVICLGDSFDDAAALDGLDESDRFWLLRLIAGRNWVWISGNHDAGPLDIAGSHRAEMQIGALTFRHIAVEGATGEVSGHFHPKARLAGSAWRCFLADTTRLILPAFGTYTGGLWCHDAALTGLMGPRALAILCCGPKTRVIPMPRVPAFSR
jgi:uncharacterized protein